MKKKNIIINIITAVAGIITIAGSITAIVRNRKEKKAADQTDQTTEEETNEPDTETSDTPEEGTEEA